QRVRGAPCRRRPVARVAGPARPAVPRRPAARRRRAAAERRSRARRPAAPRRDDSESLPGGDRSGTQGEKVSSATLAEEPPVADRTRSAPTAVGLVTPLPPRPGG